MNKPIDQFKLNIIEVRKLNDIYKFNLKVLSTGVDINGLLRAQLVFVVSSLDQYIHQVVITEMKNILVQRKTSPISFSKLLIGLDSVNLLLNALNTLNTLNTPNTNDINRINDILPILEKDISIKLGWKSFQQPDKINEALKMVCDINIWDGVALLMNRPIRDIKEQLSLIIKRRDSIAHEADLDIANQCQYPIDEQMTLESVNFIITLVYIIDSIVFKYTYQYDDVQNLLLYKN